MEVATDCPSYCNGLTKKKIGRETWFNALVVDWMLRCRCYCEKWWQINASLQRRTLKIGQVILERLAML